MTQTQAEAIARALHRAHARGLEVVGKGRRKADGATVYAVPSSSQPGRWHLVAVMGSRLVCDCQAGKLGKICQHRALVRERIELERQAERAAAQVIASAVASSSAAKAGRAGSVPRESLLNRSRPFSLMA